MTAPQYGYSHRARVLRAGEVADTWYVEIAALAIGRAIGPLPSTTAQLAAGDRVLVTQVGMTREDLVIVGRLPAVDPVTLPIGIADVTGLQTALDARATDAELTAEVNARTAAVTAEENARVLADQTLTDSVNDAVSDIAVLDGRVDTLDTQFSSLDAEMTTAQGDITALDSRVDQLETGVCVTDYQDTIGTTTSTTLTATLTGANGASLVFVAPSTGKVIVHNAANMRNSGTGYVICTYEVRTGLLIGSGTVVLAAGSEQSITSQGTDETAFGRARLITGLTAGASYNVRQFFRVQSGTGSFIRRELLVVPAR